MYARDLKIHKDVDNPIYFQFKNPDQKRVPIRGKSFIFRMFDDRVGEHKMLLELPMTVTDAAKGVARVVIPGIDLGNIRTGKYNYAVQMRSIDNTVEPTYIDDNSEIRGVIDLRSGPAPEFIPSHTLTFDPITHLTDVVGGLTSIHQNNTLHTIIIKFASDPSDPLESGFTGRLVVQGTMDNVVDQLPTANFFNIADVDFIQQTETIALNFNGIYSGVRFLIGPTLGEITEIQYRH